MRTIKFRGQDKQGCWRIGWLAETNDGTFYIAENDDGWTDDGFHNDDFSGWYKVLEKTIGQFTGLLDNKGEEIFEGDIIHIKGKTFDKDFGVVTWHENGYFFVDVSFGEFSRNCKPIGGFFDSITSNEHFKGMEFYVNGNIHDNKELIKGE